MRKYLLIILITLNFSELTAQNYLDFEFKTVPLIFGLDNNHTGKFLSPKLTENDGKLFIIRKDRRIKSSYSLRYNFVNTKNNSSIGIGFRYSSLMAMGTYIKVENVGGLKFFEPFRSDYFGLNLRYLKLISDDDVFIYFGTTIGFGQVYRRNKKLRVGTFDNNSSWDKLIEVESTENINIPLIKDLRDVNLNVNCILEKKITHYFSVSVGFEIPIIRFFFYNDRIFVPGISINNEDFFTGFDSFIMNVDNVNTMNHNFAYSLKKSNASSLNVGLRYYF